VKSECLWNDEDEKIFMFIYLSYRLLKIISKLSKKEILRNFSLYLYSQKIDEDDKREENLIYSRIYCWQNLNYSEA